jgi:hypothetical protein
MKTCSNKDCTVEHPTFYRDSSRPDGLEHRCKGCSNEKRSAHYQANKTCGDRVKLDPEQLKLNQRRWQLKHKYGLTLEQYDAMWAAQGNACAVCGTTEMVGRGWHVDHCHTSGNVRGILCHHCNVGLGHFKDDVVNLERAIGYLRK